jgi:hypothetical protein
MSNDPMADFLAREKAALGEYTSEFWGWTAGSVRVGGGVGGGVGGMDRF